MSTENEPLSNPMPPEGGHAPVPPAAPKGWKSYWKWILVAVAAIWWVDPFLKHPADPAADHDALITKSLQAYQAGQFEASLKAAQDALKINPQSPAAFNNIASAYGKLGKWDDAIANIREAIRLDPKAELYRNNLKWFKSGKDATLPPVPQSAQDHLSASLKHYQAGRFQESIHEAQEALKVKPDYALAYSNIAASYVNLKDFDQAIIAAQAALKIDPDLEIARNNLTWALQSKVTAGARK